MMSASEFRVLPPKPYYVGFSDSADICTVRIRAVRTHSDVSDVANTPSARAA